MDAGGSRRNAALRAAACAASALLAASVVAAGAATYLELLPPPAWWRRSGKRRAGELVGSSPRESRGDAAAAPKRQQGSDTPGAPESEGDAALEVEDLSFGGDVRDANAGPWGGSSVLRRERRRQAAAPDAGAPEEVAEGDAGSACACGGESAAECCGQGWLPGRQRLFVKTYGCAHNSSDSEFMMGLLRDYGYSLVDSLEDADACIVNSCTVKNPSQETAVTLTKKARDQGKPVIMSGCVPSADASLASSMSDVSMLGVTQLDRVVEVVEEALRGNVVQLLGHRKVMPSLELPKVRRNNFVEIIPISGGCLGNCSYCKTKHARGKLSSYPLDAIVARALQAASEGVSEVVLTSEDTGAYGLDIGTHIAHLLETVADALPPGVMLKLGMTNPPYMLAHVGAVAAVLQRPNVFEFIHIPVQSGSDQVLRAMVREYTSSEFRRLVDTLREKVPNILVATDVICGFPGESENDHHETMRMVEEYRFPVLNISQFYPRPGTAAARMRKLPSHTVKQRSTEMTGLFGSYATFDWLQGREERVWFSDTDLRHGQTVGHTKGYAKVVVERDDALLGKSALVSLGHATKWHVEGRVLGDVQ